MDENMKFPKIPFKEITYYWHMETQKYAPEISQYLGYIDNLSNITKHFYSTPFNILLQDFVHG